MIRYWRVRSSLSAPLSCMPAGSRGTTAHAHQCCIFQGYPKAVHRREWNWLCVNQETHVFNVQGVTASDLILQQPIGHIEYILACHVVIWEKWKWTRNFMYKKFHNCRVHVDVLNLSPFWLSPSGFFFCKNSCIIIWPILFKLSLVYLNDYNMIKLIWYEGFGFH